MLFSCTEGVVTAREGWVHSDAVKAQLEKIRREHASGLELVQKENESKLADAIKERDEAVEAFATLERTSAEDAKQLRIDRANAESANERLQQRITDVTSKIIGKLLAHFSLVCRCDSCF